MTTHPFSTNGIPQFGKLIAGQSYKDRPGAYAVIRNTIGEISVVEYRGGFFLPGGGQNESESLEECLHRELREELARIVQIDQYLGAACEYIYADEEAAYFKKIGHFYTATLCGETENAPEHQTHWMQFNKLQTQMPHESHLWAVRKAFD